ncbi:hypothetical protein C8J57DRAFT_1605752 [Mycena rebaudengoi]|nr:hypothetical protein C8J57DRAFT_1605752 [Mycena rebaudengoi]
MGRRRCSVDAQPASDDGSTTSTGSGSSSGGTTSDGENVNKWSVHDLGSSYPRAVGHNDGNNEAMPVEESGNMVIMALSYALKTGNNSHLQRYVRSPFPSMHLLPRCLFLITDSLIPVAHKTNLAIKGIVGIGAMSKIMGILGNTAQATNYSNIATSYVRQWQTLAASSTGTHLTLSYGQANSWGLLYNLYSTQGETRRYLWGLNGAGCMWREVWDNVSSSPSSPSLSSPTPTLARALSNPYASMPLASASARPYRGSPSPEHAVDLTQTDFLIPAFHPPVTKLRIVCDMIPHWPIDLVYLYGMGYTTHAPPITEEAGTRRVVLPPHPTLSLVPPSPLRTRPTHRARAGQFEMNSYAFWGRVRGEACRRRRRESAMATASRITTLARTTAMSRTTATHRSP